MIKIADPKIKVVRSPLTQRVAILAPNRANRGGLIESLERRVEEMSYFDIKPRKCGDAEFLGLPYVEKSPCVFRQGNESNTTREYAIVNVSGDVEVHPDFVFPGGYKWQMRVIDSKFPLADRVDFLTGAVYGNHRELDFVERMDAKGKDYVIITNPNHIIPAYCIDFVTLALLKRIFTQRELQDPDIKYVVVGSNNPGLPQKVIPPFMKEINIGALVGTFTRDGAELTEDARKSLNVLQRYSEGYYESHGSLSGASQPHPHGRVISLPLLSTWLEDNYKRTEEITSRNGKVSFHDYFLNHGLLIEEGRYFSLVVDPVPEFNGGLLIIAKEKQNIVDMTQDELLELGRMRGLARVLQEIFYGGLPSNDYMFQTFGEMGDKYSNTRFSLALVPRGNVQAVLELGTKIVGLHTDPRLLATGLQHLKDKYPGYLALYKQAA